MIAYAERWCPICERQLPLTQVHWHRDRSDRAGFSRVCRTCKVASARARRRERNSTTDEDRALLRALCALESGLTQWEVEFVDGLARRARDRGEDWPGLTAAQRRKARQIAERMDVV